MKSDETILQEIKQAIHLLVPDAKMSLFGSRASGNSNEESDWDILVISDSKISVKKKYAIRNIFYNITLKRGAYFDLVFSYKEEWERTGRYYSLQESIGNNFKVL